MGTSVGKLSVRAAVAATLLVFVAFAASAQEVEPGQTFASGGFDLRVDSEASYNGTPVPAATWSFKNLVPGVDKFFNFSDIKPGDSGENTVSLHAKKAPLWVCLEFRNLTQEENGINEPESLVDATPEGELAEGLEFFAWHDDGDNIFEVGEAPIFGTTTQSAAALFATTTYPIADYTHGPAVPKDGVAYFGIYWCAGDLTVDVPTATLSCEGEALGNAAQSDSLSVDVRLYATSAKEQKKFTCNKIPKPPKGPECELKVDIHIENNSSVTNTTTSSSNTGGNTSSSNKKR